MIGQDAYFAELADEGEMLCPDCTWPGVFFEELPGRPQWLVAWVNRDEFFGFVPVPRTDPITNTTEREP